MSTRPTSFVPLVPDSIRLAEALRRSAPLALLRERLQDSNRRLEALRGTLPEPLLRQLKPGPVDEEGWTLLAANAGVAAKLRQFKPRLEQVLQDRGWEVSAIRIRLQTQSVSR